jgi:hypothetical protein
MPVFDDLFEGLSAVAPIRMHLQIARMSDAPGDPGSASASPLRPPRG